MEKTFKPTSSNVYSFGKARQSKDGKWRRCYCCKIWKPMSDEYFWRTPKKHWLTDYCRECKPAPRSPQRCTVTVIGASSVRYLHTTERAKMAEYFKSRCAYCGNPLTYDNRGVVVEHYRPVSKGGESTYENLVISCRQCNQSKSNKDADKWLVKKFGEEVAKERLEQIQIFFNVAHTVYKLSDKSASKGESESLAQA